MIVSLSSSSSLPLLCISYGSMLPLKTSVLNFAPSFCEQPSPAEVERVAKRHLLSYTELKQAYNRGRKEKDKAEVR